MDDKLNILQVTDTFYPIINGVVTVADSLTDALSKTQNAFLAATKGRHKKEFRYKTLYCRGFWVPVQKDGWACLTFDPKFRRALKNTDIDVIHAHTSFRLYTFAKKLRKIKKVPLIISVHTQSHYDFKKYLKFNWIVKIAMKQLMKQYNQADEIWAINEGLKEYLIKWGAKAEKIRVLNNGCHMTAPEKPQELIDAINKRFGLSPDETVFLYTGRIMKYKNLGLILDGLKLLKDEGYKFRMIFAGDGTDFKWLKKLIRKLNLSDNVITPGMIKDKDTLKGLYLRAKLFLFPSTYDTDGLVKAEAAVCNTPSVMIKGCMAAAGLNDGEGVFLCENNAQSFAGKIKEVLSDQQWYEKVRHTAKEKLYRTWDTQAELAVKMYKEAIAALRISG